MKSKLSLFISLTVFLTCPLLAADNLKQQYVNARYAEIVCGGEIVKVDMNDVSAVRLDVTTTTAWRFYAGTSVNPDSNPSDYLSKYWMLMKNGQIYFLHGCSAVMTAWDAYKTFLYNNPQFVSVH